jgi:Protein of unknown function (DUF2851)
MTEDFLYFLWQFQQFDKTDLKTTANEALQVLTIGRQNHDAGPDFGQARLLIGGIEWAGNVEMHIKASDWHQHQHTHNRAYDSVILHVVWQNDQPIARPDGSALPTLELKPLTDSTLLVKFQNLIESPQTIVCQSQFEDVLDIHKLTMLDRTVMQRLERKAEQVHELLARNNSDWEETAYQLLANNFGFKINAEPMLRMAQNVPLKILQKHRDNQTQIEAALFGQSGFLEQIETNDEYTDTLRREYAFLDSKYGLKANQLSAHEWKYMRLRPANFPTVRLSQLASVVQHHPSLFSLFINIESAESLVKSLKVKQSEYWQGHYQLGKVAAGRVPTLGQSSIENIVINTVVPLLVAYSQHRDDRDMLDKALNLLENLPAEHNNITEQWQSLGLKVKTAFDSQATIELYNNFCTHKRCLNCSIGTAIVRQKAKA